MTRIDLTDRRGTLTGGALKAGQQGKNTVWADTTPVLNFSHYITNEMSGGQFNPGPELPGEDWCGSSDLKYAFRLKKVELRKNGVAVSGPLDSVWWWPTHKGGLISPEDPLPSQHESRCLALLSWHPSPASRNLENGGKTRPAIQHRRSMTCAIQL